MQMDVLFDPVALYYTYWINYKRDIITYNGLLKIYLIGYGDI